jgi:hypothetical protein
LKVKTRTFSWPNAVPRKPSATRATHALPKHFMILTFGKNGDERYAVKEALSAGPMADGKDPGMIF